MHAELSLAEISPAVRHNSFILHCCRKYIRGGFLRVSSVRAPPESLLDARSSDLEVHLEKLDVLQHGALKSRTEESRRGN